MLMRASRTRRGFLAMATAGLGIGLIACGRAAAPVAGGAAAPIKGAAPPQVAPAVPAASTAPAAPPKSGAAVPAEKTAGGEGGGGDEPTALFKDPTGQFSLDYPRSWGLTTQPGEAVRFTGRDEFISVAVVSTTLAPLEFGRADAPTLTAASPGYHADALKPYKVAGKDGAMVAYTWQAGPSPVTGKTVPSSANRYYIPGPPGKLAVFTYSSPTRTYDPAGADDFAHTFRWLK